MSDVLYQAWLEAGYHGMKKVMYGTPAFMAWWDVWIRLRYMGHPELLSDQAWKELLK